MLVSYSNSVPGSTSQTLKPWLCRPHTWWTSSQRVLGRAVLLRKVRHLRITNLDTDTMKLVVTTIGYNHLKIYNSNSPLTVLGAKKNMQAAQHWIMS